MYKGGGYCGEVLRYVPIEIIKKKARCEAQKAVDKKVLELHKYGMTMMDEHRKFIYDEAYEKAFYCMGGTLRALGG